MLVFDIETVPDEDLIRKVYDIEGEGIEVCLKAQDIHKESSGSTFLPHPFHKIVSIAGVITDEFGKFISVGSFPKGDSEASEEELISEFLGFIDSKNPKIVSFNGRGFDIPVIMLRAMKYNISCHSFFEENNQKYNKNKWDNYKARYSENFHLDLYDSLGHFGATRSLKLDVVCSMANIPGKFDVHGSEVLELYYSGEYEKIREYCQSDVLNTYWLMLKYELLKGNIDIEEYQLCLESLKDRIPKNRSYSDIFVQFLDIETTKNR